MTEKLPLVERRRIARKKWNDKNKEHMRQKTIEWRRNNPEKYKEQQRRNKATVASRAWNEHNKDKIVQYKKNYASRSKDKKRAYAASYAPRMFELSLKRNYGITLEFYNGMLASQQGVCAVCRQPGKKLCVDHCHATNVVRGVLCSNCNFILGHAKDDVAVLEAAIAYLKKQVIP